MRLNYVYDKRSFSYILWQWGIIFLCWAKLKNVRVFSDDDLKWVETVQCLRNTGLSLADIKKYIVLCKDGDSTLNERYEIILNQKKKAQEEIKNIKKMIYSRR